MARAHDFGRRCEELACDFLSRTGWTILMRNYRFGHKEIDIVARLGNIVAFVEVKGRKGADYGHPLDAITGRKRLEILRVAQQWVARYGEPGLTYRFDAIAVHGASGRTPAIEHVEDAWRL